MLSKNRLKSLRQLESKKHRNESGLFVAEGPKVVGDLLALSPADTLAATAEWWENHPNAQSREAILLTSDELHRLSFLQHPQHVFATFPMPTLAEEAHAPLQSITQDLCLALDGVQDPGNVGTIIRLADWFGISTIFCSPETADAYSPKVVQATMGSIARVRIIYTNLCTLIDQLPTGTPIYGTMLDGNDIYATDLLPYGLLVMGNEGNGISEAVARRLTHRLLIPSHPAGRHTADSLNVGTATAISCAEFRRRCRQ